MPPRYSEWLRYIFDRPLTANGWYFDLDLDPFEAEPSELVELVAFTLENSDSDLAAYSNEQVRYGLSYLFDSGASDIVFSVMSDDVSMPLRLRAIRSLKSLYSSVLEHRCAPVLGHTNEAGGNALNYICYMFWDISPLSYWECSRERTVFYHAVCEVLEHALGLTNRACVESGLHGLGHVFSSYPERVEEVIDAFLSKGVARHPELRQYAEAARRGHVQ